MPPDGRSPGRGTCAAAVLISPETDLSGATGLDGATDPGQIPREAKGIAIIVENKGPSVSAIPGLLQLVFRAGERPGVVAAREALASSKRVTISHDHLDRDEAPTAEPAEPRWLELLLDGMTFDLSGFAPGRAEMLAQVRNHVGIEPTEVSRLGDALTLVAGPHLEGGRNTLPVVRAQAALAAELLRLLPAAAAVVWAPARSIVGRDGFLALVDSWRAGGPFPAIGLTVMRRTFGGDVQSEGLSFFTGQELHFGHAAFPDPTEAARIGVRLVDRLVTAPPVAVTERLAGPDGEPLSLTPSRNGRYVRVGRG